MSGGLKRLDIHTNHLFKLTFEEHFEEMYDVKPLCTFCSTFNIKAVYNYFGRLTFNIESPTIESTTLNLVSRLCLISYRGLT